jgi:hypothetical protein
MKMVPRDVAEVNFIEGFSRPPWNNRESLGWLHNYLSLNKDPVPWSNISKCCYE